MHEIVSSPGLGRTRVIRLRDAGRALARAGAEPSSWLGRRWRSVNAGGCRAAAASAAASGVQPGRREPRQPRGAAGLRPSHHSRVGSRVGEPVAVRVGAAVPVAAHRRVVRWRQCAAARGARGPRRTFAPSGRTCTFAPPAPLTFTALAAGRVGRPRHGAPRAGCVRLPVPA